MTGTPLLPLSAQEACEFIRQSRPFDVARLARVLRVDRIRGLIEAQAGATWGALAQRLEVDLEESSSMRRASLARSIACNVAGPDGRPIVDHIESLTIILADGQLRRIDRTASRPLFNLVVGGQGLFGVLYSATLRIESLCRALRNAEAPKIMELSPGEACPLTVFVPPEELASWVDDARERCAAWRVAIRRLTVRRTQCESETVLRWARRPYAKATLGLALPETIGRAVRIAQLRRELVEAAISRGGSFPISCTPEATREQVERCYPQIGELLDEQERLDPTGKLENAWSRHQRRILRGERCPVRWERQPPA